MSKRLTPRKAICTLCDGYGYIMPDGVTGVTCICRKNPTADPRESGADKIIAVYRNAITGMGQYMAPIRSLPDCERALKSLYDYAKSLESTIATQQAEAERVREAAKHVLEYFGYDDPTLAEPPYPCLIELSKSLAAQQAEVERVRGAVDVDKIRKAYFYLEGLGGHEQDIADECLLPILEALTPPQVVAASPGREGD